MVAALDTVARALVAAVLALGALASFAPPPPTTTTTPTTPLAAVRPFILATDLSYLPMLDAYGTSSPFRAAPGGPTGDALAMAATGGATHVRLRLWVDPLAHNPSGWPARGDDRNG